MTHVLRTGLNWFMDTYQDDDRIMIDITLERYTKALRISAEELAMAEEINAYILSAADRLSSGEEISDEKLKREIDSIAEKYGNEYGIPIPILDREGDLDRNHAVIAEGVPLGHIIMGNQLMERQEERRRRMQASPQEAALELIDSGILIRNSWRVAGDKTICVVQTDGGPIAFPMFGAVQRFRKLVNTALTRSASSITAEAELKARECLKTKITKPQWDSYILNDCFVEQSKRSDIHYIFRKGYPTIALSYHGYEGGKAIAALCLHPMGYFEYTHCGMMTPTDEVICHLMMMRADEHKFWAKSGQWSVTDTRSGI